MEEPIVKEWTRKWFEERGYRVKLEPPVISTDREVILDFYAFKDGDPADVVWVEAKGNVGISDLLEGFIRTELAVFMGGGRGVLALPQTSARRLERYSDFFKQAPHITLLPVPDVKSKPE